MTITELVEKLEAIRDTYGDLLVFYRDTEGDTPVNGATLAQGYDIKKMEFGKPDPISRIPQIDIVSLTK